MNTYLTSDSTWVWHGLSIKQVTQYPYHFLSHNHFISQFLKTQSYHFHKSNSNLRPAIPLNMHHNPMPNSIIQFKIQIQPNKTKTQIIEKSGYLIAINSEIQSSCNNYSESMRRSRNSNRA